MQDHQDMTYINAFNLIPGIGPQKLYKISRYFDSFGDAWLAPEKEITASGLSPALVKTIEKFKTQINPEKEWQKCINQNILIITADDDLFPQKLKNISNPPFCLYVRGNINILNTPSVAVVGSRKVSDYGAHATTILAGDIARSEVVIISGLALGTDSIAHKATLDNFGTTIAVLGGGIDDDTITPRSHLSLAKDIIKNDGALISEYPIGTEPSRGTFPARNRIMAGISDATIIIEATKKSGTLITADCARKYNRPVFALPGSIFSDNALGPNQLIQNNTAQPILSSADVLKLFNKKQPSDKERLCFADTNQEKIYEIISKNSDGIQINKIIKEIGLDTTIVSSTIILMEIDGILKNIGNQTYIAQK